MFFLFHIIWTASFVLQHTSLRCIKLSNILYKFKIYTYIHANGHIIVACVSVSKPICLRRLYAATNVTENLFLFTCANKLPKAIKSSCLVTHKISTCCSSLLFLVFILLNICVYLVFNKNYTFVRYNKISCLKVNLETYVLHFVQ